jgi:hypothetical protein
MGVQHVASVKKILKITKKTSFVLKRLMSNNGGMATTRFLSIGSLRALAASRRRGHLAGSTWSSVVDRDLDRMTSDLLALAQSADATGSKAARVTRPAEPVDLHDRRTRGRRPTNPTLSATGTHARAS